jgi:hypothetical protein
MMMVRNMYALYVLTSELMRAQVNPVIGYERDAGVGRWADSSMGGYFREKRAH